MTDKIYEWKIKGIWDADATVVGHELERLEELTPESVLNLAKNPSNPLHDLFEWDDSVAANKYRLQQARSIIQQITIVYDHPNSQPRKVRAFVSTDRGDGHYHLIDAVVKDVDQYALLLEHAIKELKAFGKKYKDLSELEDIIKLIDQL